MWLSPSSHPEPQGDAEDGSHVPRLVGQQDSGGLVSTDRADQPPLGVL